MPLRLHICLSDYIKVHQLRQKIKGRKLQMSSLLLWGHLMIKQEVLKDFKSCGILRWIWLMVSSSGTSSEWEWHWPATRRRSSTASSPWGPRWTRSLQWRCDLTDQEHTSAVFCRRPSSHQPPCILRDPLRRAGEPAHTLWLQSNLSPPTKLHPSVCSTAQVFGSFLVAAVCPGNSSEPSQLRPPLYNGTPRFLNLFY